MWCPKCEKDKPESEFYPRQTQCRACHKIYMHENYLAHCEEYKERARLFKESYRAEIRKLKERPCADCDEEYPYYVMDFDHISDDKEADVSRLCNSGCLKRALAEAKKCDVVCSNCHRIRTFERMKAGSSIG
jgi:hypothetical protein